MHGSGSLFSQSGKSKRVAKKMQNLYYVLSDLIVFHNFKVKICRFISKQYSPKPFQH